VINTRFGVQVAPIDCRRLYRPVWQDGKIVNESPNALNLSSLLGNVPEGNFVVGFTATKAGL
jgi:hypothetical protein